MTLESYYTQTNFQSAQRKSPNLRLKSVLKIGHKTLSVRASVTRCWNKKQPKFFLTLPKKYDSSNFALTVFKIAQKVTKIGVPPQLRGFICTFHPSESHAYHLCFHQFLFELCNVEKTKINKKRPELAHFLKKSLNNLATFIRKSALARAKKVLQYQSLFVLILHLVLRRLSVPLVLF